MNNLRILLYMMLLSLAACHPEGTSVKQGLDKAAQLMEQDPDTASIILETIQSSQMNEAQLAEYNLLCTQLNEDKNIPHSSDKQIKQAASYYEKHGDEYQKSKVYYYLACVESDLMSYLFAVSYLIANTVVKKVRKGVWRMPRLTEAMKDVISCDKLRVGANNP